MIHAGKELHEIGLQMEREVPQELLGPLDRAVRALTPPAGVAVEEDALLSAVPAR